MSERSSSPTVTSLADALRAVVDHARAGGAGALALGWGAWSATDALREAEVRVETVDADWATVQLDRRFPVVVVAPGAGRLPEDRVAVLHCAVQHTVPGGLVVTQFEPTPMAVELDEFDDDDLAARFSLEVMILSGTEGNPMRVHRRTERYTVHDMVFEARRSIRRLRPAELALRLAADDPPLVVDTRTPTDRHRFGVIPGAVHIPRTVLEWHLDPANGYPHPAVRGFDTPMVIVCNGGYSSSLAAASLTALGFRDVADLVGGHHGWLAAGLPVVEADHSHLDY